MTDIKYDRDSHRAVFDGRSSSTFGNGRWTAEEATRAGFEVVELTPKQKEDLANFRADKSQVDNLPEIAKQVMADIFTVTALTLQKSLDAANKSMELTNQGLSPRTDDTQPDSFPQKTGLFPELVKASEQTDNAVAKIEQSMSRVSKLLGEKPKKKKRKLKEDIDELFPDEDGDPLTVLEQRDASINNADIETYWDWSQELFTAARQTKTLW